jgi:hypothetical protein
MDFQPVRRLRDVSRAVQLQPLESGDPRYVDLSGGRRTDDLAEMRVCLEDFDAQENRFAKIAFTGHRGCGKSTELLRLEHDVTTRFTPLHFYATEDEIVADYDYSELILDLVHAIIARFQEWRLPLNDRLADDIATWFAEVTVGEVEKVKKEIELGVNAEAKAKLGLLPVAVSLLARLRSSIAGSNEKRLEIRRNLQKDPMELIRRFDLLLDNAHVALQKAGKPANLLIVVDNLDRLTASVGRTLFFDSGDLLKLPRAHFIYTVPIAIALSPQNIGTVFEQSFTLPMVKVRSREEKRFKAGIDALIEVTKKRIDLDMVFDSMPVVRKLIESCGGSVRDLMRLIVYAQQAARAKDKETIDSESAKRAVNKLRLDFEKLLVPAGSYFPLLARIHQSKADGAPNETTLDPERVQAYRVFFSQLLTNGSVLEYNGNETWYDVHPVIQEIRAFRDASTPSSGGMNYGQESG